MDIWEYNCLPLKWDLVKCQMLVFWWPKCYLFKDWSQIFVWKDICSRYLVFRQSSYNEYECWCPCHVIPYSVSCVETYMWMPTWIWVVLPRSSAKRARNCTEIKRDHQLLSCLIFDTLQIKLPFFTHCLDTLQIKLPFFTHCLTSKPSSRLSCLDRPFSQTCEHKVCTYLHMCAKVVWQHTEILFCKTLIKHTKLIRQYITSDSLYCVTKISVLLNLLCVLILFQKVCSQLCFRFLKLKTWFIQSSMQGMSLFFSFF